MTTRLMLNWRAKHLRQANIRAAFKMKRTARKHLPICVVRSSERKTPPPGPDQMFLDLNLPEKNGGRVVEELNRDPDLCPIPVIIFSTSQSTRDIKGCYEAGADCYVNKPVRLEDFFSAIWSIVQFWFGSAQLPEEGNDGI